MTTLQRLERCPDLLVAASLPRRGHERTIGAMERQALTAADGFQLATMHWPAAGRPRAVLQLVHGMAEHLSRYAPFAEACAAANLAVFGHDQRGHGASINPHTPRGHFADEDGWAKVVADLALVHRHLGALYPGLPIFLFGHSMGAFVARAFLLQRADTLAGAILSATGWRTGLLGAVMRWFARREVRRHGPQAPSRLMTKLVFGTFNLQFAPTRTPFDWLSRDRAQVESYLKDPLCGFDCSGQLWVDLLTGERDLERAEDDPARLSPTLPLLLLAGRRDPVSLGGLGNRQLAKRYRQAGNQQVTVRGYPGARHELLNELNHDAVWGDLLQWIGGRLAPGQTAIPGAAEPGQPS